MTVSRPKKNVAGFTLVELAIVMIIIGLLIGGILKGQQLVANARMAGLVTKIREIDTANLTFLDVYRAVPGDMKNATTRLPGCTADSHCINGNGDRILGIGPITYTTHQPWMDVAATIESENVQYWKHLALAGMIGGLNGGAAEIDWGQTHPTAVMRGGFHARSSVAPPGHGSMNGLTLVFRNYLDGAWHCGGGESTGDGCAVDPFEAYRIDQKMDDGQAYSGVVQSISGNWSYGCGLANTGRNGPDGYDRNGTERLCDMMFKVKEY